MANAVIRPASRRENAHRRRAWTRPFRRTRRAIERSLQLIDSCGRVIEAAEQFAAVRPARIVREIERASGWMGEAMAQLDVAARALRKTTDRAAQSPDVALDAPAKLVVVTAQWVKAAERLAVSSERLGDTSAWLRDSVTSGAIPMIADPEKSVATIKLTRAPLRPPDWFSYERYVAPCIPSRRRRPVRLALAEAARRVFRGRAPPSVPTCSL